jgi:hypothetical protein
MASGGVQDSGSGHHDFSSYRHSSKTRRARAPGPLKIGSIPEHAVYWPQVPTAEKR